jgi:hypothetical protein
MTTTPEIRRANRRLLICLILFALGLALSVYFWMRTKIRENGGVVDPTYSMQLEMHGRAGLNRHEAATGPVALQSGT